MISFEHTGPERPAIRWARNILVGAFLAVGAILLFPFTLLTLFLRALGYLANPRPESG
jgi:hypothetical protein